MIAKFPSPSTDAIIDEIDVYLESQNDRIIKIKTYDCRTTAEIKVLLVDLLKSKEDGPILYTANYLSSPYFPYIILLRIETTKSPYVLLNQRRLSFFEKPF